MASHGVPRVSQVDKPDDKARDKEAKEIQRYRALVDLFNRRVLLEHEGEKKDGEERLDQSATKSADESLSTFDIASKLLKQNPEYYTVWNHRRRLLSTQFAALSPPEIASVLQSDLQFLIPLLIKFPKCYWIWNHRLWLLEQATARLPVVEARAFWTDELRLVAQMLARDGRNFHGWGYRRTVVAALESEALAPEVGDGGGGEGGASEKGKEGGAAPERKRESRTQQEFDYTTQMTRTNLSNFSAWHNRSKLIPRLLTERGADATARKAMLDEELTLIQEALYTDPYDQSIWFYHSFLTTAFSASAALSAASVAPGLTGAERAGYLDAQVDMVHEMLEGAEDCKWIFQALVEMATTQRRDAGRWPEGITVEDIWGWMDELEKLDPLRKGRWRDVRAGVEELMAGSDSI